MNLRSRIVLAVALVFAGISLLAGWLMLARAESSLRTAFDRAAQTRADWLLSLISVDPVVLPLPSEREQMRVVYSTYGHARELFRSPGFPPDGVSRRGTDHSYSYHTVTSQTVLDRQPDGRITVTLAVPDLSLQQDIRLLQSLFGIGWLISLLLALGVGYVVAGWLLRPIQSIVKQADTISNATDSAPIALPETRDELYQLTDALNRMLVRIRENVDLQRNFFGAAAHELRTPLTVMKTGLEVTLGSGQVVDPTKSFLVSQLDEVSRLARLLDEFLTLSRPSDGVPVRKRESVMMLDLAQKCIRQLATATTEYDVSIQVETAITAQEMIYTDGKKLEHVLLNLLENAIKYAVESSPIVLEIVHTDTWLIRVKNQTVRENGPTLDLLQPFFRADPLKEGHGLGLWISHRLTMLLDGELHLYWQHFTFTCELYLP